MLAVGSKQDSQPIMMKPHSVSSDAGAGTVAASSGFSISSGVAGTEHTATDPGTSPARCIPSHL